MDLRTVNVTRYIMPLREEVPCPHWPKRMMILNMSSNLGSRPRNQGAYR